MMNNEDTPRNMPYQQGRKPMANKHYDNRGYSNENRYGQNAGYGNGYNSGYSNNNSGGYNQGQHQRPRRVERFHRDPVNYTEKLTRQNDLIIKLLKEIRDRLPAPVYVPAPEAELEGSANRNEAAADHDGANQGEQCDQAADVAAIDQPEADSIEEQHEIGNC